ncbi:hypothetical protein OH76DRAFT_1409293 [Lentinus brumalis]|uniref:F-box domain-containing protein n=1 Tax=Lentinus brumalis TaxID=2498619 RepID=A0A371CV77_9APHY|nr:hypothetical protein OH76DRAFT_1409293 [Polyporus brumalis]
MAQAVAQALACEDISREVFGHLEGEGTLSTLASVARVNRALSPPALAAIWRKLDNILQLFAVIPTFGCHRGSDTYIFDWDPTEDEWERFMSYARLVQHMDAYNLHHINPSVWKAVTEYVGCTPLFPQLQRLDRLYVDPYLPRESLVHLLSPNLRQVHLVPGPEMRGVLEEAVLSGLSHVDGLNIAHHRFGSEDEHIRELTFWTFFGSVRDLEVRQSADLTLEKLRGFAAMPHLRSLIIEVRSFAKDATKASHCAFASLETLQCKATLRDMRALVTSTFFPQLKVVDICVWRTAEDQGVSAATRAILAHLALAGRESLRTISFGLARSPSDHYFELPSDLRSMSDVLVDELLQCPGLHTLELAIHVPSALWKNLRVYDRDLRHIKSSWPALRKLMLDVAWSDNEADSLPRFPDASIAPPLTVHTLAEYAQAHPQL